MTAHTDISAETRQQFAPLLEALKVETEDRLTLGGQPAPPIPPALAEHYARSQPTAQPIQHWLQFVTYSQGYCRRYDGTIKDDLRNYNADPDFMAGLSAANASQDRRETGWRVARTEPSGAIIAERHGRRMRFYPGQYWTEATDRIPVTPGQPVGVIWPRGSVTMQEGAYFAFGETPSETRDEDRTLRLYWSITAQGAGDLLHMLSATLNRFRVPFRIKLQGQPLAYDRLDAVVLYLERDHFRWTMETLRDLLPGLDNVCRADRPLFTLPIRPGVSLAEDPGRSNTSFGEFRCMLVARAIFEAWKAGDQTAAGRFARLSELFAAEGLSMACPYLQRGTTDMYQLDDGFWGRP